MRGRRHSQGFTLIEAMLAMTILAAAVAGVVLPYAYGASEQAEGSRQTLAGILAADLMEQVMAHDFATLKATYNNRSELQGELLDATGATMTDSAYADYSRVVTVEDIPYGAVLMYRVTVWVYRDGRLAAKTATFVDAE